MPSTELTARMHAVLDGLATPAEAAALERDLAADPAARAEFEHWRALFADLAALPQPHPPEGLVAAVSAALPARASNDGRQPLASSRVLGSLPPGGARPTPPLHHLFARTFRRDSMTQSASIFSNRKTWIGAGVAAAAMVVVVQLGSDGDPKKEDVTGTVVAAQRYRAPQGAAQDIQLGDASVAQLLQNEGFVRMLKDPQVRAMALDPAFQAAAKVMLAHPEAAKVMLANNEAAKFLSQNDAAAKAVLQNAEASRAMRANAEAARVLLANPEAAQFMQRNPQLAKFVAANAEAAKYLTANAEAAQFLAANAEAAKFMLANNEAARALLQNAELAKFMAANPEAARFMLAHDEAAKHAATHAEAARFLLANSDVARLFMANSEAARLLLSNNEAARLLMQGNEAARVMLAHPEAARLLMANPQASRLLMQSPEASIRAMYQSIDADRIAK